MTKPLNRHLLLGHNYRLDKNETRQQDMSKAQLGSSASRTVHIDGCRHAASRNKLAKPFSQEADDGVPMRHQSAVRTVMDSGLDQHELQVTHSKLCTINGFTTNAAGVREVASLQHEIGNDPVED